MINRVGKDVRWNRGGEALGKMHGDLQKSAKDTTLKRQAVPVCSFQHRLKGAAQGVCGMARCGGQCAAVRWGLARGVVGCTAQRACVIIKRLLITLNAF